MHYTRHRLDAGQFVDLHPLIDGKGLLSTSHTSASMLGSQIVDRQAWSSGNKLVLLIVGTQFTPEVPLLRIRWDHISHASDKLRLDLF